MATITSLALPRLGDANIGLRFEDQRWTWDEVMREAAARNAWFQAVRRPGPPHVGVMLENVPDFVFWLTAAALGGFTIVGVNPTRRGAELARDITYTDCQVLITERALAGLVEGLDLGPASEPGRLVVVDEPGASARYDAFRAAPVEAAPGIEPGTQLLLVFTSGTSGAPKAVICTHGRLHRITGSMLGLTQLGPSDVTYMSMPLFHSNGLFAGWAPTMAAGATLVLRRRFSASGFLPDVRRYGATYFNYVGKPLAYILATPERLDDADNPLRMGFGNEGGNADIVRFAQRFGCRIEDGYGSTETGVSISRTPDTPPQALGRAADTVKILDADTGQECPRARFDADGQLLNAEDCIGEIVNLAGGAMFEGYWNNEEANAQRVRQGAYWSGDLGYRDEAGFFYFAGRSAEWMRVDGENFAAAPVERILGRFPGVVLAAVYGVPDEQVGDRVMAALQLAPGVHFDEQAFDQFLAAQPDLGPKWWPSYVRIAESLPMTETNKVVKRLLQHQRWEVSDPVWWRPGTRGPYARMSPADVTRIREAFHAHDRGHVLTT